jgi:hypothetical protein
MRVQLLSRLRRRDGEDGAVAVIVALLATTLLVLAAFAVDIGNAYAQGRQVSVAMDAAALSAAAKVGDLMPRDQACSAGLLASIDAQTVAQAEADRINQENRKNGLPEAVDSVTVACADSNRAVEVQVGNSRGVPTALGGLIGIEAIEAGNRAAARYVRKRVAGGLRPWAVCDNTALTAQQNPGTTYVAGLDNKLGVCTSQAAGNWGSVDFDGGSNSAGVLADWTQNGYPGSVFIPSVLPADPGVSNSNALGNAFNSLVGQVVLFPTTTGYNAGGGNNASFNAVGIITVKVCGIYYQNNTYNAGSDCWVDPVAGTSTPGTPQVVEVNGGAMNSSNANGNNRFRLTVPVDTFTADMANNPDVTIRVRGAGQNGADLVTTIDSFVDARTVILDDRARTTVSNARVTITTQTYTTTPGVPVGIEFENNGNPVNHIQFRWVNYTTSSYTGSDAQNCALDDRQCVGQTVLWQ